jgi:hypothetical protein
MGEFIRTGPVAEFPEEVTAPALRAIERMEAEFEALEMSIAKPGGLERASDMVHGWAAENPIDTSIVTRRSTSAELARFTAQAKPGLSRAVGTLTESVGDVWARLDVYSTYLPKQARWQAELVVRQVLAGEEVGGAFDDFTRITDAIDRIAETVEHAPDIVEREREELLRALQAERVAALETLNKEFTATVDLLIEARIEMAAEVIEAERLAVLEALTAERIAILEAIHQERVATLEEMDQIVGGLAEDAMRRVVDHLFLRTVQLILGLLVVGVIIGIVVFRILARSRQGTA